MLRNGDIGIAAKLDNIIVGYGWAKLKKVRMNFSI